MTNPRQAHINLPRLTGLTIIFVLSLLVIGTVRAQDPIYLDWSSYRIAQIGCGLVDTTHAGSYSDIDQDALQWDDLLILLSNDSPQYTFCPSVKIRNRNGGQSHVYTMTLDGETRNDCSQHRIVFSEPVYDLHFQVLDIDKPLINNWQDQVALSPAWSTISHYDHIQVDESSHTLRGMRSCDSAENDCNVALSFHEPLREIAFKYCYGPDVQGIILDRQMINISDITFKPYTASPQVEAQSNCPMEASYLLLQDYYSTSDEHLEIIITDASYKILDIIQQEETLYGTANIPITFDQCGIYHVTAHIKIKEEPTLTMGSIVPADMFDGESSATFSITDDEPPYFQDMLPDVIELTCEDQIPDQAYRPTGDACPSLSLIDQEVIDIDMNQGACDQSSFMRYWTITDLCGNTAVDSMYYHVTRAPSESEQLGIIMANAISPNGDGVNDHYSLWLPPTYTARGIEIYHRSGILLHSEAIAGSGKITTQFGGDLRTWREAGVYIYILQYDSPTDQGMALKGTFSILY